MKQDPKKLGVPQLWTANNHTGQTKGTPHQRHVNCEGSAGESAMVVNDIQAECQARRTQVSHTRAAMSFRPITPGTVVTSLIQEQNSEPQRGLGPCLKSHSRKLAELAFKPRCVCHMK